MATVIGARFSISQFTSIYEWLIKQLPQLLDYYATETVYNDDTVQNFIEGTKIYITNSTYLYIYRRGSGNPYHICIEGGNDTAGSAHVGDSNSTVIIDSRYGCYVELIQSEKGDILISYYQPSGSSVISTIEREKCVYTAIVKCNNVISDDDTYGIVMFHRGTGDHHINYFITDDTELFQDFATNNRVVPITNSTTSQHLYTGMNTNAKITVLMPITGVASECVSVNSYTVFFTPEWTCGNAELNGKRYYFAHQFVMLDE